MAGVGGGEFVWRIQAVELLDGIRFALELAQFRDGSLHAVSGFIVGDGRRDASVWGISQKVGIKGVDESEAGPLALVALCWGDEG